MTPPTAWNRKHLLGLEDLSREEILSILDTAESFSEVSRRSRKKVPALQGRVVFNLFFENSTRTRTSFSLAAKRLSADVQDFSASVSSLTKGETFIDTAKNLPIKFTGTGTESGKKTSGLVSYSKWNEPISLATPTGAIPASSITASS